MTWPTVITKLAEIGLDEHAPKLKELGYDSMDAFDASDKAALEKIADQLDLKPGHKAKFAKKFSEESGYPKLETTPVGIPEAVAPGNIVVNVNAGGGAGNDNETKIPATWLIGTWITNGTTDSCCFPDAIEIAAVGADAFDIKVGDDKVTYTRMGHTNNFTPVGEPKLNTLTGDISECFLCCCGWYLCGSGIASQHLKLMVLVNENNLRGGSELRMQKNPPTDFKNETADAATGPGGSPETQIMDR